jgi:hypothetical protein
MTTTQQVQLKWEDKAKAKYDAMIAKIPVFHREIAKKVVDKKARLNAVERGAFEVEEQDIVKAFFTEVPKAFYSLMIRLMDEVGFDYRSCQES